ncbi:MAG: transglycosylase SLT domain-containing protein [Bryobacteraceae bacterium]
MSQQARAQSGARAWLIFRSGPAAGSRFPISNGTTRIGSAPDNDVVVAGAEAASPHHLEIARDGGACWVRDLGSATGTWLNGKRINRGEITLPGIIQLGSQGPEFVVVVEEEAPARMEAHEIAMAAAAQASAGDSGHEHLLAVAVARARSMRARGMGGQTMTIMRGVVEQALRQNRRRYRIVGYSLLLALIAVTSLGIWKVAALDREKRAIDARIRQLETQLQQSKEARETDRLLSQFTGYQDQAQSLQRSLFYRLSWNEDGDFVARGIHSLMAEFGAEVYSIPPEFTERVNHYIEQDQGGDRPLITYALGEAHGQIQTIKRILQEEQLPVDLAYIPIVESALQNHPASSAAAAGPWQFTVSSAKALGLRVDGQVDERKDLVKSTRASCKYLRDLILDFGAGSSVMLALAAYNSGAGKVKQAVVNTVCDPIQQRNFWYLYRVRALPLETREFVPKVFAAMVIGRDPHHFGF